MTRLTSRLLAATLVAYIALSISACSVPLAPGYRILKESQEVNFVPGSPPELQVRALYTLQNSGTSDLSFIDVIFPDERSFGRKNLRVELDGHETTPASLPAEYRQTQPNTLRFTSNTPWARGEKRELAIEYALSSPEDQGTRITLADSSFHLGFGQGFTTLQPPKNFLSPNPVRPKVMSYAVRVPSDFVVLARGTPKGRKKYDSEFEYRFELGKNDLSSYVVSGRYAASTTNRKSRTAVFWTIQPLKEGPGPAAESITAAWKVLEADFGSLGKDRAVPDIVESPGLRGHFADESGPAAAAFPGGALVNPAALALGTNSSAFLDIVTHALAHDWFGDEILPSPDAALGMGEGLPEYATIAIEQARNGDAARRQRVIVYLREYDAARMNAEEKPLGITMLTDQPQQRRIGLAKAALFFAALEDACGESVMNKGLAHLVSATRGQEASYNALRSALEQSSGKNLAEMFRVWLNDKDVPQEFRQRYQ